MTAVLYAFVGVDEAARLLGVSSQRVRFLLARGRLLGFRDFQGGRPVWRVQSPLHLRPRPPGRPRTSRRAAKP